MIEEYIVITFLLEFPVAGLENLHTGKSFYIGGPEQYYCTVYFVTSYIKSLNLKFCVKLYIHFKQMNWPINTSFTFFFL